MGQTSDFTPPPVTPIPLQPNSVIVTNKFKQLQSLPLSAFGACAFDPCQPSVQVQPNGTLEADANGNLSFVVPQNAVPVMNSVFNVLNYGADATGISDSTAAFNNAIAAMSAAGGILWLPCGTYRAHDITVFIPVRVAGPSSGCATVDYSGATSVAFLFTTSGWPKVTRRNMVVGQGVQDLTFTTGGTSSTRALDFQGGTACFVHRVRLTGSGSFNGLRLYGVWGCDVDGLSTGYFISPTNIFVEVTGDLSGVCDPGLPSCGSSPFACTLGNCSTRTDAVTLRNLNSSGNSGTGVYLHDAVFTVIGEHILIENRQYGLQTSCVAGRPDITYCPQEITFTDFESEGATVANYFLRDSSNFKCMQCYALGNPAGNNVDMELANYAEAGGAGNDLRWVGGRVFGANFSCFEVGVDDVKISDAAIYDCNAGNHGSAGIELAKGKLAGIVNNQFCTFAGTVPTVMAAVLVDSAASEVGLVNNFYYGCNVGLVNNSAAGSTVKEVNANGP